MNACFCRVGISYFPYQAKRLAWGNASEMSYFVSSETTIQSIDQILPVTGVQIGLLHSTYPTWCYKIIQLCPTVRVLPSGPLSGLRKSLDVKAMMLSTELVDDRARGLHIGRSTRRGRTCHIVYYTSVDCNPSTLFYFYFYLLLLLFDLLWIRCKTGSLQFRSS